MAKQLVVFQLEDEVYGVDINQVRGIEKLMPLTRVPHAPDFVKGVCNLRGSVIPVIDLKKRLSLAKAEVEPSRVIIVNVGRHTVGMTIDAASDVITLDEDKIEPSPSLIMGGIDSQFIAGVAKVNNRLLIILDLERVLTVDEINELEDVR